MTEQRLQIPALEASDALRSRDGVRVDARQIGDHLLLVVAGEADLLSARTLRAALVGALSPATRSVAVDVSQLRFCDLAGLDALADFCTEASARRVPSAIHGMSPLLRWMRDSFAPAVPVSSDAPATSPTTKGP